MKKFFAENELRWNTEFLLNKYAEIVHDESKSKLLKIENYIRYLNEKNNRFFLLRENIKSIYSKYFSEKKSQKIGNNLTYLTYEYSNYFELMANLLNSCYDLIAHIINYVFLNNTIKDNKVSFYVLLAYKSIIGKHTFKVLESIKDSDAFLYIRAFINTIKHQKIIKTKYKLGHQNSFLADFKYPFIENFEYKGKKYPQYTLDEFVKILNTNAKNIIDIGTMINKDLEYKSNIFEINKGK